MFVIQALNFDEDDDDDHETESDNLDQSNNVEDCNEGEDCVYNSDENDDLIQEVDGVGDDTETDDDEPTLNLPYPGPEIMNPKQKIQHGY